LGVMMYPGLLPRPGGFAEMVRQAYVRDQSFLQ